MVYPFRQATMSLASCVVDPQVTELFPVIGEIDSVVQNKLKKRVEKYNLYGF